MQPRNPTDTPASYQSTSEGSGKFRKKRFRRRDFRGAVSGGLKRGEGWKQDVGSGVISVVVSMASAVIGMSGRSENAAACGVGRARRRQREDRRERALCRLELERVLAG